MAAYNHRINDEDYFRVVDVETLDLPYRDRARQLLIRAAREVQSTGTMPYTGKLHPAQRTDLQLVSGSIC